MTIRLNSADCFTAIRSRFDEGLTQVRRLGQRIYTDCSVDANRVAIVAAEIFAKIAVNYIGISTMIACPISAVILVPTLIVANLLISSLARQYQAELNLRMQSFF